MILILRERTWSVFAQLEALEDVLLRDSIRSRYSVLNLRLVVPRALQIGRANAVSLSAGIIILLAVPTRTNAQGPVPLAKCQINLAGGFLNDDLGRYPDPTYGYPPNAPVTFTMPRIASYTVDFVVPDEYDFFGIPGLKSDVTSQIILGPQESFSTLWTCNPANHGCDTKQPIDATNISDPDIRVDVGMLSYTTNLTRLPRLMEGDWVTASPVTIELHIIGTCVAINRLDPTDFIFESLDARLFSTASISFYGPPDPAPYCIITAADDELDLGEHAIGSGRQGVAATMANAPQTATAHVTANLGGLSPALNVVLISPAELENTNNPSHKVTFTPEWARSTDRTGSYSAIQGSSDSLNLPGKHEVYYIFGGMARTGVKGTHMPGMYTGVMMVTVTCS